MADDECGMVVGIGHETALDEDVDDVNVGVEVVGQVVGSVECEEESLVSSPPIVLLRTNTVVVSSNSIVLL